MKPSNISAMWGGGTFLLLTIAFFLMLILPFDWGVSIIFAGVLVFVGLGLMTYLTIKSK